MARFFVSGCMGCVVVVVTALFIRQPGGIAPGMVYYGASIGFLVSAIVGITRPFWFVDTIRGRKAGEKFHPPFYGGGWLNRLSIHPTQHDSAPRGILLSKLAPFSWDYFVTPEVFCRFERDAHQLLEAEAETNIVTVTI
jgi:hypothetical protein